MPAGSLQARCDHVFADLKTFCQQHGLGLHMQALTKTILGIPIMSKFPVASFGFYTALSFLIITGAMYICNIKFDMYIYIYTYPDRSWFKGSDTRSIMRYIEKKLDTILADYQGPDEVFLQILYGSPLWMDWQDALKVSNFGLDFMRRFTELATLAFDKGVPKFQLTFKLHMWAHVMHQLGQEAERKCVVPSPCAGVVNFSRKDVQFSKDMSS